MFGVITRTISFGNDEVLMTNTYYPPSTMYGGYNSCIQLICLCNHYIKIITLKGIHIRYTSPTDYNVYFRNTPLVIWLCLSEIWHPP